MKVLAIGAHPDDIEPQIGGTLARLVNGGAEAVIVSATSTSTGAASVDSRNAEAERAARCLGGSFLSLGVDPHEFDFSRRFISIFDDLFSVERPDLVFTVNSEDSHHEHQFVSQCIRSASRKNVFSLVSLNQAFPGGVGGHSHNYFSDISQFQSVKVKSIMCYESQISKYGEEWLEAIISRDRCWGFNLGADYVEVAHIDKWIC